MNKLYYTAALVASGVLLGPLAAQAQLAGAITGLIISGVSKSQNQFRGPAIGYPKGQYQLGNGTWQAGKLSYDWQTLYVSDPHTKDKHAPVTTYPVDSVRRFVTVRGDTFCVVRRFTVPRTKEYVRSSFARKMYRAGDIQVNEYTDFPVGLRAAQPYTLLCRADTTIVVPATTPEMQRLTVYMVRDYPELAAQVQKMKDFQPENMQIVLEAYGRWKDYNNRPK